MLLGNRLRLAATSDLAAQGQSVSRKNGAEVPLTGLSFDGSPGANAARSAARRPSKATPPCRPDAIHSSGGRMAGKRRVLLVGWDAADWKVISPLVDV